MKILFLNTNLGYAGAEKMIVWVANQCAEAGNDVTFFTYREDLKMQALNEKVKHVHVHLEDNGGNFKMFSTISYLHKYIKYEQFDLGIAFLSPSILRLSLAAIGTSIKVLFSQRGDPYSKGIAISWKHKLFGKLYDFAFKRADAYVFQTTQAQNYYSSSIRSRSIVIPNPIKPLVRTVERIGHVEKRIVNVGRIDFNQKRQDLLVCAFKRICSNYPDYVLEFYGDGADENLLLDLIKGNEQIKYMGRASNVAAVLQNASMFILSSDFEGIPNALLEAMSLGVPCISTDCSPGGAALLINNGTNGLLVPRGDIENLSQAISYYLENPKIAEMHGNCALRVNSDYCEERVSKSWLNFINKLVYCK